MSLAAAFSWLIPGIYLPDYIQDMQCPVSTYSHGVLKVTLMVWGLAIGALSGLFLPIPVGAKFKWWRSANGRPIFTYDPQSMAFVVVAEIVAGVLVLAAADSYFCATPDSVVLKQGYIDPPRNLSWDSVNVISAFCERVTPSRGRPYRTAWIQLRFRSGDDLHFALGTDDEPPRINDYKGLRRSLATIQYKYEMGSTVTPELCPPEIYSWLRNWETSAGASQ